MKSFIFLLLIAMFFINVNASTLPEFTEEQQVRHLQGMKFCMRQLNQTCKYPTLKVFTLPIPFLVDMSNLNYPAGIVRLSTETSLSQGLNSLYVERSGRKCIIECLLALSFAGLEGIRRVIDNDELFDAVYEIKVFMHYMDHRSFPKINSLIKVIKSTKKEPGTIFYLEQVKLSREYFSCNDGLMDERPKFPMSSVYAAKHPMSCLQGHNCIFTRTTGTTGITDEDECINFDPGQGTSTAKSVALRLVDALDADSTELDEKCIKPSCQAFLNSFKYKNREEASVKILSTASSSYRKFDYTEVFETITVLWYLRHAPVALQTIGLIPGPAELRYAKAFSSVGKIKILSKPLSIFESTSSNS